MHLLPTGQSSLRVLVYEVDEEQVKFAHVFSQHTWQATMTERSSGILAVCPLVWQLVSFKQCGKASS